MNEYLHGVLVGIDEALAAVFFSPTPNDITISSRCGMVELGQTGLSPLEHRILLEGAKALNAIEPGHCRAAIRGDLLRARKILSVLEPYEEMVNDPQRT
jgi:hypothetical protein